MNRFLGGLLVVFLVVGLATIAGAAGYQAGFSQGAASAVAAGADGGTVVVPPGAYGYGWGPGFGGWGILWFLFGLLAIFVIVRIAIGAGRGWRGGWAGPGGYGPGRFGPGSFDPSSDDPRARWIGEMHRRLHERDVTAADGERDGTTS